jgi:methyl-CpG-binding domain protein 4
MLRTPEQQSPFGLIQEHVVHGDELDGWRVLLACALCNVSRGVRAKHVLDEVLRRWPTPSALAAADPIEVEAMVFPLGLQKTRAKRLIAISQAVLDPQLQAPHDYRGVGPYACDAWSIFVDRVLPYTEPEDGMLALYWRWAVRA